MSEYIPLEIQAEILKRLPVKPLIQFRSVSKPWKSLIDSPDFIAAYGVRQTNPNRFILRYADPVYSDYYPDDYKYTTFVDNDDDHSFVQQELIPTVPGLIQALEPQSSVVGSSNGLLCLKVYCEYPKGHPSKRRGIDMVLLWNPSIRKSVCIQAPYENFGNDRHDDVFGFGVCPATLDPIIIKIKCIGWKMKDMPDISVPWKVRAFTLSTGTWRILSSNLPRESIRLKGSQVVIDRFIYWVAFDMLDAEEDGRFPSRFRIMSFDLTAKEFKEINLTDSSTIQLRDIQTISELRGSLVLLEYHREFEEDVSVCCCCLWMMKGQGDSRSFSKLYNINLPDATIHQILGFRKTGELIMETREEFEQHAEVQTYKPNYEYTDNLGIDGEPYSFFMCSYMETLLLLDQSDSYIYSNNM